MASTLYVGNLSQEVQPADLRKLFAKYGRILSIEPKNGFAFVDMETRRSCDDAIFRLHGSKYFGNTLRVELAHSESDRRFTSMPVLPPPLPPLPSPPTCYKCGGVGHIARDCPSGDKSGTGNTGRHHRRPPPPPPSEPRSAALPRLSGDSYRPRQQPATASSQSRYRDPYEGLPPPPFSPPSRYHHYPPPPPYDRYHRGRSGPPDYARYGRYDPYYPPPPLPPPPPRGPYGYDHRRENHPSHAGRSYERRRSPPVQRRRSPSLERRSKRRSSSSSSRRSSSPKRRSRSPVVTRRAPRTPSPRA
ncbi:hypothetical protein BDA99DRAFT_493919 [Phascolomyces articulosus]|uniref:Uncharacterized protein n=1 Tax=Phascolomyces articulosus TaxID=60185 RepID=A0AAD5KAQ8_9FUNG|nr:hypothetical protein BDA99DRAFT_493919 [Phascolomyces articulosus]